MAKIGSGGRLLGEGKRSVAEVPTGGAAAPREEGERPGEMARPASPALRRRILARDGHSCRDCSTMRTGLRVQPIGWRSKDGPTTPKDLTVLCGRCHALVREGLLTVEGEAPPALTFQRQDGKEDASGDGTVTLVVDPPRRGAAAPRKSAVAMTFEALPQEVDAAWWRRHQRLLNWNVRRGVFLLEEGVADDEAVARPRHEAPASKGGVPTPSF